jgi:TPR repeat protein/tRNA A-37 threonylcarbamoyl transferase component Bud32
MSTLDTFGPGTVFARDFTIVRLLSEGGMGAVYVVQQNSTGAQRALKLMHRELVREPRLRERFEQEARVGARIESEHVVQVIAAGIDDASGTPWLAMELLQGQDLAALIEQRGPLPAAEVREIFAQLTHAIAAAHRVGIVHRDLKPENVFVGVSHREGVAQMVKVLDFGIAKVVAEAKATTTQALGTPIWMAPEQTEAGRRITPATDVWPLGLIAFRMLTGKHFWVSANSHEATPTMVLREAILDPIVPASARAHEYGRAACLPPGFDAWFAGCVARPVEARFQDAGAARDAFARMLAAAPTAQAFTPPGHPPPGFSPPAFTPTVAAPPPPRMPYAAPPQGAVTAPRKSGPGGVLAGVGVGAFVVLLLTAGAVRSCARAEKVAACDAGRGDDLLDACRAACAADAARGFCAKHGDLARREGDAASLEEAKKSYARGCRAGDLAACAGRGSMADLAGEDEAAVESFTKACDGKVHAGCIGLARHLARGRGVTRDLARAIGLYETACAATDDPAARASCELLAFAEEDRPLPRIGREAIEALYKKAALDVVTACEQRGDLARCVEYGFMQQTGRGVAANATAAAGLFRKACDGGVREGCVDGAVLSVVGSDAVAKLREATDALDKACDAEDAAACNDLAVIRAGLPFSLQQDAGESVLVFACSKSVELGCSDAGGVVASPTVQADLTKATAKLEHACKAGFGVACGNLGALVENGVGAAKDRRRAKELYAKGCASGATIGCGPPGGPFKKGDTWGGTYTCAQGVTDAALRVTEVGNDGRVSMIFDFDYGKGTVPGRFLVSGPFDAGTGALVMRPGAWLEQPPHWISVPFHGEVSALGTSFLGVMDNPSCGAIHLVRQTSDVVSATCGPDQRFVEGHGCQPAPRTPPARTALGTWTGQGQQAGSSWLLEAHVTSFETGVCATVKYPSLGCTGSWYCLKSTDGSSLRAREIIETGTRCDTSGTVEMSVADDGQSASWRWSSPKHASTATARLGRAGPP